MLGNFNWQMQTSLRLWGRHCDHLRSAMPDLKYKPSMTPVNDNESLQHNRIGHSTQGMRGAKANKGDYCQIPRGLSKIFLVFRLG